VYDDIGQVYSKSSASKCVWSYGKTYTENQLSLDAHDDMGQVIL
jgi:hypothetical protein